MKLRYTLGLVAMMMCTTLGANVLSPRLKNEMQAVKMARKAAKATDDVTYRPLIVKVDSVEAVAGIVDAGGVVLHQRDKLLLLCMPTDKLDALEGMKYVSRAEMTGCVTPTMDCARAMGRVDKVQAEGQYTGTGVLVGFSDLGFEPNNIEFIDETTQKSRVKMVAHYLPTKASKNVAMTEEEVAQWTTDDDTYWHATHVCGTIAGGYKGNSYYGVATGADILATTSELDEVAILAGIEDMIDYAKDAKKPLAVNLSIGSYTGPHDGSDLFCQYLDRCGEDAIICISSGNEADSQGSQTFDFTADDEVHKTLIQDKAKYTGMSVQGECDWWSADSRMMEVQVGIYDMYKKEDIYTSSWIDGSEKWTLGSEVFRMGRTGVDNAEVFDNCYTGWVTVSGELNDENNRYNVLVSYDLTSKEYYPDQKYSRYYLTVAVRAKTGCRVYGYTDQTGSFFSGNNIGCVKGNGEQSISNIACGKNVIVVGSSNSRNTVSLTDGTAKKWNFSTDRVSAFSSYGTLLDGRQLPHICAPGNYIVSSISSYYTANHSESYPVVMEEHNGRKYYWGAHCGTSMSCPYVTGVAALWLQADPTLTVEDVRNVAQVTAITNYSDFPSAQWGAGEIDAYAGLTMVKNMAGISTVKSDDDDITVAIRGKVINVYTALDSIVTRVYNCNGSVVKTTTDKEIDCSDLPRGIYIIAVDSRHVTKMVL